MRVVQQSRCDGGNGVQSVSGRGSQGEPPHVRVPSRVVDFHAHVQVAELSPDKRDTVYHKTDMAFLVYAFVALIFYPITMWFGNPCRCVRLSFACVVVFPHSCVAVTQTTATRTDIFSSTCWPPSGYRANPVSPFCMLVCLGVFTRLCVDCCVLATRGGSSRCFG